MLRGQTLHQIAGERALPLRRRQSSFGNKEAPEEDMTKRLQVLVAACAALAAVGTPALATVMVGGAPMYPSKNIVENALHSKDHTTLVAAVKAAGLVDTLEGAGPFTVFAPTNHAFAKLPKSTVATLMQPINKSTLTKVLTYHVVPGRYTARELMDKIKQGGGKTMLKTVEGEDLTLTLAGRTIVITDAKGGRSRVTVPDVLQSNGVIHVVNTVLMPG